MLRCLGVQVFRCLGVQVFRCFGVLVFRCLGVLFRCGLLVSVFSLNVAASCPQVVDIAATRVGGHHMVTRSRLRSFHPQRHCSAKDVLAPEKIWTALDTGNTHTHKTKNARTRSVSNGRPTHTPKWRDPGTHISQEVPGRGGRREGGS